MSKKHFTMLAHDYEPSKHRVAGQYVSEKLDGIRMIWDGGISRGLPASDVPYANCEKHARFKTPPIATGLWSRYGQPIQAPAWFLDNLPPFCLDGEAWTKTGDWERISSIVKKTVKLDPNEWLDIKYMVFDAPSIYDLFADRVIDETNFKKELKGCIPWALARAKELEWNLEFNHAPWSVKILSTRILSRLSDPCKWHFQEELPANEFDAISRLNELAAEVAAKGGEGLIVRAKHSIWTPERTYNLLKVKPEKDAEATVVGYTFGRATDRGSKLLGLMGALIVKDKRGNEFMMSGFTDAERELECTGQFAHHSAKNYASARPGEEAPSYVHNPLFPRGSQVTFKYRELSKLGIPKECRYWRRA